MKENRQVVILNLNEILPNRFQPRIKFDEKAIIELSESIKEHGIIQPIIVRKINDKYEIIAGERRYKASVMAGKSTIPAIIVDLNDKDSSEIALIENVQRQDLTPIEEAISYRKILDMGYLTQEALATKLGVAQSTIANKLRLLNLDDEVQDALLDGKISERHARSLLRLNKMSDQRQMLNKIINERLTVRKTDEVITSMLKNNEINVFDSIENNANKTFEMTNEPNVVNTENPFMINNQVNINNQNVSTNTSSVEVLDFGFEEVKPQEEIMNIPIQNDIVENNIQNIDIPSNPIIEDVEVEVQPEITEQLNEDTTYNLNNSNDNLNYISDEEDDKSNLQNIKIDNLNDLSINQSLTIENEFVEEKKLNQNVIESPISEPNFENIPNENIIENLQENEQSLSRPGRFFNMFPQEMEEPEVTFENNILNEKIQVQDQDNNLMNDVFSQSLNVEPQIINEQVEMDQLAIENENNFNPNVLNSFVHESNSVNEIVPEKIEEIEPPISQTITPLQPETLDFENININNNSNIDMNEFISNQEEPIEESTTPTLREIISQIRRFADDIERQGFEIDSEEFDFEDIYQVILKIKKN